MRIRSIGLLAAGAIIAATLSACGTSADETAATETTPAAEAKLSAAFAVSGALGDQGFFDDAETGLKQLADEGHKTTTLQADANNPAQWKANLESLSTGEWDIVVAGTWQMVDILTAAAKKLPDQKYVLFDAVVEAPNVASIVYKQNEGSFLAGALAATAATDTKSFPLSKGSKTIGVVGGMDIPVINDFIVGFKAGAKAVDPSVKVVVSYVGSFTDSAKGYDQAKAMFGDGADVVFQVAGGSGTGVLQAAKDANKYAIGVDSNQNAVQPGHVLASMTKNIGNTIALAVRAAQDGTLNFGSTTSYGLSNDGVGLTFADNGDSVPQAVVDQIEALKAKVVSGEITVPSAF